MNGPWNTPGWRFWFWINITAITLSAAGIIMAIGLLLRWW